MGVIVLLFFGLFFCFCFDLGNFFRDKRRVAFVIGFAVGVLLAIIAYVIVFAVLVNGRDG